MAVSITYKGDSILIQIHSSRIEGKNEIFETLMEYDIPSDIETIEFDMERIQYINSLGIAELVSIYRYFTQEKSLKNIRFRFIRVKPEIAQLLRIVELADIVEIETTP